MSHWTLSAIRKWDELRDRAGVLGWPINKNLTVAECARQSNNPWYHARVHDRVADFLDLTGKQLTQLRRFGRIKVQSLIEIIDYCIVQTVGTERGDQSLEEDPPHTATSMCEKLVDLGIPEDLSLDLVRLPTRMANFCSNNQVETLGQLLEAWEGMGEAYFLDLPNLGRQSVGSLRELAYAVSKRDTSSLPTWLPYSHDGNGLSLVAGLWQLVRGLEKEHRKMMEKRLVHGMTLEESAIEFGITRERVRQVEALLFRKAERLLAFFPEDRNRMLEAWMAHESMLPPSDATMPDEDAVLAEAMVAGFFRELPEGAARALEMEVRVEHWRDMLKRHPDLLVEGVDLEEFMRVHVPEQHWEDLCQALDGRGRIRLDQTIGRVVHTGPRLREVVKAILAKEDDPIPLTWLHELVRRTPTHGHVQRDAIFRYKAQWKSDDPSFPHRMILWNE